MFKITSRPLEINYKDIIELFVAENIMYMFDLKNRTRKPDLVRILYDDDESTHNDNQGCTIKISNFVTELQRYHHSKILV